MSETVKPRIMGGEIELGLVCRDESNKVVTNRSLLPAFKNCLPKGLVSFGDFLSNGARLYSDINDHLEYATPECTSFEDLAARELAGEQVALHALHELRTDGYISSFRLHKRVRRSQDNKDPNDRPTYWGAHENYQIGRELDPTRGPALMALAGHLATRNALVGAGDFSGKRYSVAQKALSISELVSSSTTSSRALVNSRDEPLDQVIKYRRLHLICGDANVLPWSIAMKFGTTALVLRMIEEGLDVSDLNLENPIQANRVTATDPTLRKTVKLADGRTIHPVQHQAELAARAQTLAEKIELPEEEVRVINDWQGACEDIVQDPERLLNLSDWVTRQFVLEGRERRHSDLSNNERKATAMEYDMLGQSPGTGVKIRAYSPGPSPEAISSAIVNPPTDTRAYLRGRAVLVAAKHRPGPISKINWNEVQLHQGRTYRMTARHNRHPHLEAAIGL